MKETAVKGAVGTVLPIMAALNLLQLEIWLRVTSLAVGIAVGIVTLVGMIRRWNKP